MQHKSIQSYPNTDTCLIIEDSEFDQKMMTRVIGRMHGKMQIKVANSLHAARQALGSGEFSLILLDNNLPDGIGANFALELSGNPKHARTPVIMVSDWPTPFMWEKAATAGVLYVVNKAEFCVQYVERALQRGAQKQPVAG